MDYERLYRTQQIMPLQPQPGRKAEDLNIPDTDDMVELARYCATLAIKALAWIAVNGEKEAARVAACNALLDRGYGKPGQSVTVYAGTAERKAAWSAVGDMLDETRERASARTQ